MARDTTKRTGAGRTQVRHLAVGDVILWGGRLATITASEPRGDLWYLASVLGDEMTTAPAAPVQRLRPATAVVAA